MNNKGKAQRESQICLPKKNLLYIIKSLYYIISSLKKGVFLYTNILFKNKTKKVETNKNYGGIPHLKKKDKNLFLYKKVL